MATQRFLSPGVFTNEIDQSFLAEGVQGIGAVVIGRSPAGPAFWPTKVGGFGEFAARFKGTDPNMDAPYAARNYLKNSNSLTFVRILGHADGTSTNSGYIVGGITAIADGTGSNAQVLAVVHHSGTAAVVSVSGVAGDPNKFVFSVTGPTTFAATASFLTSSDTYIAKVLNTDPTKYSTYGHYLYQAFRYTQLKASSSWCGVSVTGALTNFLRDYSEGISSWIFSQPLGGLEFDLFRFHTIGSGRAENDRIKITFANVKQSPSPSINPYGTFDVLVRDFNDTDLRPIILEQFTGLTLDPSSLNYIARRIGDSYEQFDTVQRKFVATGIYRSKSRYVYVEMNTAANFPPESLPFGFHGYAKMKWTNNTITGVSVTASFSVPDMPYTPNQFDGNGNFNPNFCWGVNFVSGSIADRMRAFPDAVTSLTASDADFSLKHLSGNYVNGTLRYTYVAAWTGSYAPVYSSASMHKFTLPFAGGFDGFDLRVADPMYLQSSDTESTIGVVAAKRAVDTVANPDAFDMNLLAIPGVFNYKVTDYARAMVNDRRDAMYIMDITGASVQEAIDQLKGRDLDDNYTACYYPDLKLDDKASNQIVRVPPSVAVLAAFAYSDKVGQVFFAPAGLNRGGLGQFDIVDVVDRLNFNDRNDLYDNRINPIASFPAEGIVVFGQKTLQLKASALDRVNVRRLLIFAKKTIASAAKYLLFEPDNPATWQRFTNTVNPILDKVRQDQGVNRFKVVMNESTNTQDLIDRNTMKGKIFLEPTKSGEFIDLDFVITNAGVSFGD